MNIVSQPNHPGKIVFIDGDTDEVVSEDPIAEVPEELQFAETDRGPVPIVKVVSRTKGEERTISEYGPDDELLRRTVQIRDAD